MGEKREFLGEGLIFVIVFLLSMGASFALSPTSPLNVSTTIRESNRAAYNLMLVDPFKSCMSMRELKTMAGRTDSRIVYRGDDHTVMELQYGTKFYMALFNAFGRQTQIVFERMPNTESWCLSNSGETL